MAASDRCHRCWQTERWPPSGRKRAPRTESRDTSKRPEVHVGIHDRGLGLARAIVARRIILPKHLQGRLGDTTGEPKGSEENQQEKPVTSQGVAR